MDKRKKTNSNVFLTLMSSESPDERAAAIILFLYGIVSNKTFQCFYSSTIASNLEFVGIWITIEVKDQKPVISHAHFSYSNSSASFILFELENMTNSWKLSI